jgi:serine/threonine protein kinase
MTPDQWQKVESVLQEALDRPPGDRVSFLDEACAGDDELLKEANSLIDAYENAGNFIEEPALTQDAHLLLGDDVTGKLGSRIGPYKIISRLGAGGMGEVYLAEDERLGRLVALKILPVYFASDETRLRRFQREARAASALNHPNILTIHEVGEIEGVYFIATEFIDGATIRQLLVESELSLDEILDIAEQVASALAAAHAAGIVHRDIKPENVMRRSDGLVKILDFGIAKLMESQPADYGDEPQAAGAHTEAGLVMGTVNYMSPEQARGLQVDERTDIWSLGVVVYEMLGRRLPFKAGTRMDTLVAILDRDPPSLSEVASSYYGLSPRLEQIVNRCLHKSAADRFQTAKELLVGLKGLRQESSKSSQSDPVFSFPRDEVRISGWAGRSFSRRYAWPILSLVLILIAATAATTLYRRSRATTPPAATAPNSVSIVWKLYSQMNETEQLAFVREQEQRISAMMGDRPAKLNPKALQVIKQYIDRYAARRERVGDEETLDNIYARAPQYIPLIARSFGARRVPVIIGIYLPVIESAYRPCFENSFGSKGLFQFLPQTAKRYGVSYEEMCDAEKMTPAAAHYMADHMAELGDDAESMTLVLLSYNTGAQWVRNALRELRDADDYQRNFWTLFAHRDELGENFRQEGAGYVPNFFAAAIIGENPKTFGLSLPPLSSLAEKQ